MKREIPAEYLLPPRQSVPQKQRSPISRIVPEQRGERQFVRVPMPFVVEHDGRTISGRDLSLDGFAIVEPLVAAVTGETLDCRLRLMFKGYELTFNVECHVVSGGQDGKPQTFQITSMDEAQREVLRKTIRAFLSGQLITFEGLLLPSDAQTERQRRQRVEDLEEEEEQRDEAVPWKRHARYAAIGLGALVMFSFLVTSLFQRLAVTESRFAALTAPRIDIRAPSEGRLAAHDLTAGTMVQPDQRLSEVIDATLQADVALAAAEYRRMGMTVAAASTDGAGPVDRVIASPRGAGGVSLAQLRAPEPVELASTVPTASHADLEVSRIRLAALEHRQQANRLFSPCDCEVTWAVPGGEWVEKGEQIFTLIRTEPSMMSVVALVHMSDVASIEPHDEAYLQLPQTGEMVEARVLSVRLDPDRGPRSGFPAWVAQDQSLASVELVPSKPLPAGLVGVPMKVYFTSWPTLTRMTGGS
ncbi:MAG: PilZ domain-containing protein [Geminicoccaceae bacterium]